jgi:hypothetical protein
MNPLAWFGVGASLLLLPTFYFVRKIPAYLALASILVLAFAVLSWPFADHDQPTEWLVLVVGLMLCVFGLLIVRVMLIRSVSLHLLAEIAEGRSSRNEERLGGRLDDMRAFGLIRSTGGLNELTGFGKLVGVVVSTFYSMVGVEK